MSATVATSPTALDAVRRLEREIADDLRAAREAAAALLAEAEAEAAAILDAARTRSLAAQDSANAAALAAADAESDLMRHAAADRAVAIERFAECHRSALAAELSLAVLPPEGRP